jgi:hypothetical protein
MAKNHFAFVRVRSELPSYAAPLFLRIMDSGSAMDVTSTFKHKKNDLVEEGFDPRVVKVIFLKEPIFDLIYFLL